MILVGRSEGGWGGEGKKRGCSKYVSGVCMGKFDDICARGMAVTDHTLSWVYVYMACVWATVYDTPLLNISECKETR